MIDLEPISQFSRQNCVAICAFLVPANLFLTASSFVFLLKSKTFALRFSASVAVLFSLTLFLHVATWFLIGVVTPVTFILGGMGATCILTNLILVIYQNFLGNYLLNLFNKLKLSIALKS